MEMIGRASNGEDLYMEVFGDSEDVSEEAFSDFIADRIGSRFRAEHAMHEVRAIGMGQSVVPPGTLDF